VSVHATERGLSAENNMTTTAPPDSLLPFTRLVLVVSAVVQLLFGVIGEFFIGLLNGVLWTAPLAPWPPEVAHYAFINYLAGAIAAVYALYQGTWRGARVYFAFSFSYIALGLVVNLITAVQPGVPPIMWAYVLLSVLYLPAVAVAWNRQARIA
jgi:hypothetical protein